MDKNPGEMVKDIWGDERVREELAEMSRYVEFLEMENNRLKLEIGQYEQILNETNPIEDYIDIILEEDWLISTSSIADDYGLDLETFEYLLYMCDILDLFDGEPVLESEHNGMGYTVSDVTEYIELNGSIRIKLDINWTQRGRLFIYNELRDMDVLPLIEQ